MLLIALILGEISVYPQDRVMIKLLCFPDEKKYFSIPHLVWKGNFLLPLRVENVFRTLCYKLYIESLYLLVVV